MRDVNTLVICGNLTRDAEFKVTGSGAELCTFRIAHTRHVFNKQTSNWDDANTTFWNVNYWGRDAEALHHELLKGTRVCVVGRVEQRQYQTKDGEDRYSLDIMAESVSVIPKLKKSQNMGGGSGWASQQQERQAFGDYGKPPF